MYSTEASSSWKNETRRLYNNFSLSSLFSQKQLLWQDWVVVGVIDYNSNPKKENHMKNIGKWLFLIGLLVAVVAGLFGFSAGWLAWILVIVGILAGVFYFDPDDVAHMGIRYLVLVATAAILDELPILGPYLTGIFTAAVAFLGPVVLTVLVVWFVRKHLLGKK